MTVNKKFWMECLRIGPLLGVAGIFILTDDAKHVIGFGVAIIALAVAIAHIIRKLIFPYIDMAKLVDGIEDDTKASAAVICGLIFLLCTIIQSLVALLR
jgi:hypothetical protein